MYIFSVHVSVAGKATRVPMRVCESRATKACDGDGRPELAAWCSVALPPAYAGVSLHLVVPCSGE